MSQRPFAKLVLTLACVASLTGVMIAFIAKPAAAEFPAKYTCLNPSSCTLGSFHCSATCDAGGTCSCTIS